MLGLTRSFRNYSDYSLGSFPQGFPLAIFMASGRVPNMVRILSIIETIQFFVRAYGSYVAVLHEPINMKHHGIARVAEK